MSRTPRDAACSIASIQQASQGIGERSRRHVRDRVGAMLGPPPKRTVSPRVERRHVGDDQAPLMGRASRAPLAARHPSAAITSSVVVTRATLRMA
jgi:hypothetical protein